MSLSSFFSHLLTTKHLPGPVAAVLQPTVDAAKAIVPAAINTVNPTLDAAASQLSSALDGYLAQLGVAGALLTPEAHLAIALGASALKATIDEHLGPVAPVA